MSASWSGSSTVRPREAPTGRPRGNATSGFLRRIAARAVGVGLCVALGLLVVRPGYSAEDRAALADGLAFTSHTVAGPPVGARTVRTVAPSLSGIDAWISAVGAAVGLADVRGLGRAADACLVDPRDDSVTVRPVPQAGGPQYAPIRLDPVGLRFDATMAPMGCVPADLDEDGDQDITVFYWGRSPVVFLDVDGPGMPEQAAYRPVELVTPMQVWNSTGLNVGDVDGDGHLDVLVANYFPDDARILDPASRDARIRMQDSMSLAHNGGQNRLLLTTPTGVPDTLPALSDASSALPATAAASWTLATGLQDLTGDLLPEIYLANDFGPDHLLVNHSVPGRVRLDAVVGSRDLVTPKSQVLGRDSFKGMGVAFTYAAGSSLPHIMVSNITTPYALHESNFLFTPAGSGADLLTGHVPYVETSERAGIARGGWSWDVKAGDFDNDGVDELMQATGFLQGGTNRWPELQELAMGNDDLLRFPGAWPSFHPGDDLSGHESNPLWVRGPGGRYADLAPDLGIAFPDVSRGIALGDIDADGRLDALVANQWQDSRLLHNRGARAPAAGVRLELPAGAGATRPALGARLQVHDPAGVRTAQLYPANGHAGVSAAELHLALPGGVPLPATLTWRDTDGLHHAEVMVAPGRSTFLLGPDGSAVPR